MSEEKAGFVFIVSFKDIEEVVVCEFKIFAASMRAAEYKARLAFDGRGTQWETAVFVDVSRAIGLLKNCLCMTMQGCTHQQKR